jgi:hypothetical protein
MTKVSYSYNCNNDTSKYIHTTDTDLICVTLIAVQLVYDLYSNDSQPSPP